jgi:hypothetical protein
MKYRIEQYEIWTQAYVVEAESKTAAILKLIAGGGEISEEEGHLQYVEVCEEYGVDLCDISEADEEALIAGGLRMKEDFIPSIASIEPA